MNKCYRCKQPVATWLKLKTLALEKAQYCPNCRARLSFPLLWAVFCGLLSFFGALAVALYLGKSTQSTNEWIRIIFTVWPTFTLLGIWITVTFLPLGPYEDWTELILWILYGTFIFGGVLIIMLFYESFIAY